ncbi:MAG: hypothetical protein ACRC0F_07930 [Cetobacterium sp.]
MENILKEVLSKHNDKIRLLCLEKENEISNMKAYYEEQLKLKDEKYKAELLGKEKSTRIRWDKTGKYFSLSDFCRNTKDILFIKEAEYKQYLFSKGILDKLDNNYFPKSESCVRFEGELYVSYSEIREMLLLRSLVYIGNSDVLDEFADSFFKNKDIMTEQLANTVYIECKTKSDEFRNHRDNVHYIHNDTKTRIE